jgi:lipopolysaccharide export system permease protein
MHLSSTLSFYLAKKFLIGLAFTFIILMAIVFLVDTVELLRRAAKTESAGFTIALQLAALKLPTLMLKLLPFAALFGAVWTFASLTRSHELVVARAAGVSAWQFLAPAVGLAFGVGVLAVVAFNPVASVMVSKYERLESDVLEGRASQLAVSDSGLWLRQANDKGQAVIHATSVSSGGAELRNVIVFTYSGSDTFVARIDAESARLQNKYWDISKAVITYANQEVENLDNYRLATDLSLEDIHDSFAPPETLSFWSLPGFIKSLETAGFSAFRHRLHWHGLLAMPLLLSAMVILAATFTMRQSRRGGAGVMIASGVMAAFVLYFVSDIVSAFGLAGTLPVALAAWMPAGLSILLGLALMLHLEDG